MGAILPNYRKTVVDDIISAITSNTAYYYAFASGPKTRTGAIPSISLEDYNTKFLTDWEMLFGKRLIPTDVIPVIINTPWQQDTTYDIYNNRLPNNYSTNTNFYVVTDSATPGAGFDIYMCLDNANGSPSQDVPDLQQANSFIKNDGYIWRYITTVSSAVYNKFAYGTYVPVYANNTIISAAGLYSGVDVVMISDGGAGYATYANGIVESNPYPNIIQIEADRPSLSNFFVNCGMYIFTPQYNHGEIKTISSYVVNSSGNWIILDSDANTNNIIPGVSQYTISPRIIFQTDGSVQPEGYSVVNAIASVNSIHKVVMINNGQNISRANVSILPGYSDQDANFRAANLYAITPPPGGYGYDPISQLGVQGIAIAFDFSNNESGNIPTQLHYNRVGLMHYNSSSGAQKIFKINSNTGASTTVPYTNSYFTTLIKASMNPAVSFNVGDTVIGNTTGAMGTVVFVNTSVVYISGDKKFSNTEVITSNGNLTTEITINKDAGNNYIRGDIYTKNIEPLYIQNLADVQRSNSLNESYKLVIKI